MSSGRTVFVQGLSFVIKKGRPSEVPRRALHVPETKYPFRQLAVGEYLEFEIKHDGTGTDWKRRTNGIRVCAWSQGKTHDMGFVTRKVGPNILRVYRVR